MIRTIGCVLLALFTWACSDTSGEYAMAQAGSSTLSAGYCESRCAKLEECDPSRDRQTCTASCENELAARGPKLRPEYLSYLESCVVAEQCESVQSGDAEALCAEEASASLAPTAAGVAFCDVLAAVADGCELSADKDVCLETVQPYSSATLTTAKLCLSKACGEIDACVAAELGIEPSAQYRSAS